MSRRTMYVRQSCGPICCQTIDEAGTAERQPESSALLSNPSNPSDFGFWGCCDFNFLYFLVGWRRFEARDKFELYVQWFLVS